MMYYDCVCAVCRSLDDIKDREICCYSVSCKERENIGKFVLLLLFNVLLPADGWVGVHHVFTNT